MFAIVETGGKQYKVTKGDIIRVEKLEVELGDKVKLEKVLMLSKGDEITVGNPLVEGASVTGKVVGSGKGKKINILKFKPKNGYRKRLGHRQPFTDLEITAVKGA